MYKAYKMKNSCMPFLRVSLIIVFFVDSCQYLRDENVAFFRNMC